MEGRRDTLFGSWLRETIQGQGKTVRGVARDIAQKSRGGATERNVETARRALNKYLREGKLPSPPMRRSIADALDVDVSEMPDDSDEPITREMVLRKIDEHAADLRRFRRAIEGGLVI